MEINFGQSLQIIIEGHNIYVGGPIKQSNHMGCFNEMHMERY